MQSLLWPLMVATILCGQLTLLAELRNRYFSTYRRKPVVVGTRILLSLLATLLLGLPLLLRFAPGADPLRHLLMPWHAGAAWVIMLHFAFPHRRGIRRIHARHTRKQELAHGIRLSVQHVNMAAETPRELLHILHLTDLHGDSRAQLDRIATAFENLREPEPDIIVVTGDLGEDEDYFKQLLPMLGDLPAKHGRYFVRGNHDFSRERRRWLPAFIEEHGIRHLANAAVYVPGIDATLVGIESPWSPAPLPQPEWRGLQIGLAHSPDCIGIFEQLGVRLGFCGHTHGGKLHLPLLGPLITPSRHGRFFAHEWFERNGCRVYISAGIGYLAGRLGQHGEVSRILVDFTDPQPGRSPHHI